MDDTKIVPQTLFDTEKRLSKFDKSDCVGSDRYDVKMVYFPWHSSWDFMQQAFHVDSVLAGYLGLIFSLLVIVFRLKLSA